MWTQFYFMPLVTEFVTFSNDKCYVQPFYFTANSTPPVLRRLRSSHFVFPSSN